MVLGDLLAYVQDALAVVPVAGSCRASAVGSSRDELRAVVLPYCWRVDPGTRRSIALVQLTKCFKGEQKGKVLRTEMGKDIACFWCDTQ